MPGGEQFGALFDATPGLVNRCGVKRNSVIPPSDRETSSLPDRCRDVSDLESSAFPPHDRAAESRERRYECVTDEVRLEPACARLLHLPA